jgi:ribosomal protein S18 acetylase RimI-like enzyme
MSPLIREATAADASQLARLRWEFRVEEQNREARAEFLETTMTWFGSALSSGRWIVAVAELEPGYLCGCICLQMIEKVPAPGGRHRAWGYVTNAYVDMNARGQGVGGRLLGLLIEMARDRNLEFLIVWPSDDAVAFYHRAGFRAVTEAAGNNDSGPLHLVF